MLLRPLISLLGLCTALVLATGCGQREAQVDRGIREQVLHRAIDADPVDLDPHLVTGLSEFKIIAALFEPLVRNDPTTLRPVPALAERWDVSPDGLVYTFHLRQTAQWSNGEPITAQDCVDSWRRILTPSLAAEYAYGLYAIRGAEAYHKARTTDFASVGVTATDARTLQVTLERPVSYFLELLVQPSWTPVHVRSIAALGDPYRRGSQWTKPGKLVASGPFVLKDWIPGQHVIVEKSPTYWDRAAVRLNAIHFYPLDNGDAQERAFRAGQLHVTEILLASKITAYRRNQSQLLRIDPYLDTYFFRFNTRRAPLDDARVRQALSLAIDRTALAQKVLLGGQQPTAALVPPRLPDYTPPARPLTDLARARQLLADAGYNETNKLPTLELLISAKGVGPIVGEAVQEIWRRDLGLDVRLLQQEQKVILAERRVGNYQILLSDWVGDYFDATTFLDLWQSDSGNNHTGWRSADYDALLADAARALDPAARAALLQKAETLMLDAAPIAPLYYNTHVYLLHPAVKGWQPNPLDGLDYKHVWLEK